MANIMVDIETLGQNANAAIVSIGAVAFTDDGLDKEFYTNLSISSNIKAGRTITGETLEWWFNQSSEAKLALVNPEPLKFEDGLAEFKNFVTGTFKLKKDCIWANGVSFDLGILRHALKGQGMVVPWQYWQECCMRSLRAIEKKFNMSWQECKKNTTGVHHNALDDAKLQAQYIVDFCKGK